MALFVPRAWGQEVAVGEVSGVISDTTGAPIAGAAVRMTATSTQLVRNTNTDNQGRYALPNLPVGPYQLDVSANGFKSYVQSGIVLQVGNNVQINVVMQLGSISESVQVTADATMVDTRENAISQVIDERRIVDLPLNGRQVTQLILLSGAAVTAPAGDFRGSKNYWSSTTISVAGGQANSVNYLLDGGDNNDSMTNVNLPIPFPDALQEFSVQTSNLPARYGMHPGAVVNAITKSGTNDWHGGVFDFLRNGDVNARNFFAPAHDTLKRNQFGGTLGGRIIRDKLFFFGGFQGMFNRQDPPQTVSYVPTAAVLNGDFGTIDSGACVSGGRAITILDPTTGQPFPNNQIPVGRLNSQALNLAKYLPATQNPCGKIIYGIPATGDEDQGILRIDWVQSAKHSFLGRYYVADYRNPAVFDGKNLLTTTQAGNVERTQTLTLGDTYTFSSHTVNSFHATATRRRIDRGPAPNDISPQTVGINVPTPVPNYIELSVSGYFSVGCGTCRDAFFNSNSFAFADDVDIIRGRHQIGFGVAYVRDQFNSVNVLYSNGTFSFNGQYASGKTVGDALAAFMLGTMSDFQQSANTENAIRGTIFQPYVQDSIRLTPRLTVNLGLRWEPWLVPYDYFNRGESFSKTAFDAGQRSTVYTNAPAGLLFYGDRGIPTGFENRRLANFSPRAGIVWDPTGSGRQTIRVSAGILRDTEMMFYNERQAQNPPYATQTDVPYPAGGLSNPWAGYPGGTPFPIPSPVPSNFTFPTAGVYVIVPLSLKPTYMAQWNVSYQRQLSPNWMASVSYLGNKTTHVWSAEDINPAQYIAGNSASTNLRRPLYLQNPTLGAAYSSITAADQGASANYNALLLSVQHRFSQGFTLLTNYTWSHCLSDSDFTGDLAGSQYQNPKNRAADYGNCNFDIRHQSNTSIIITSPVKGSGFAGHVFGHWQFSPIVSMHTGLVMNVTAGVDISQTGIGLDRPNVVMPNAYLSASDPTRYLNRAAFQNAVPGAFGNLGRDVLVPLGAVNFDLSLSRRFHLKERCQLETRAEAMNVINHPNFAAPGTSLSSSTFGVITSTLGSANGGASSPGDPRILQFALKLYF
jgi:hypothetical protein